MQETGVKAESVGEVVQVYIDVGYTIINIQKTGDDSYAVTAE
jgi:hypothetical protein